MFLEQYWGGPKAYGERRGHPRLRMRHAPFPVSPAAKDAWLRHMNAALDEDALAPMHDAAMRDYFERAAHSMRSEGHTSEVQSRGHVVCRLLLERKRRTLNRMGSADRCDA